MTLQLVDIAAEYDGRFLYRNASLTVDTGEIVSLVGPSGSGKSTLLRAVAGLVRPSRGSVRIDGTDVTHTPTHKRGVGLVFQNNQLFPHLDVAGNVGYGLRIAGMAASARIARVGDLLGLVGLSGYEQRDVSTLSGGEAARVAVARSLATAPRVLLLDEPLSGLDHDLRYLLADELRRVIVAAGTTAVVVTHDPVEAQRVADDVVRLADLSSR